MRVVCDIECDSLTPTRIWVIVCKDIDSGEVSIFREPDRNPRDFLAYASNVDLWVGHNFIGFDLGVLFSLVAGYSCNPLGVVDTFVVSRLLNYNVAGGHSLEAWGERLGFPKIKFNDFSQLTQEMVDYCVRDVEVNYKLFKHFEKYIYSEDYRDALRLEHNIAIVCNDLHSSGFSFDYEEAKRIHEEISREVDTLTRELQEAYPPKSKLVREIEPRETKFGTISRTDFRWEGEDLSAYTAGWPFSRFEWIEFNPGSPAHRIDVLWDAGWEPYEKTDGHREAERELRTCRDGERLNVLREKMIRYERYGWTTSEENLGTLPETAPEAARKLVRWLLVNSRRSTLEEWFKAYDERTGRIHGSFQHIGAWTGRMAHKGPNMANIPSVDPKYKDPTLKEIATDYGKRLRKLWVVPEDKVLVGCDADGIQLRVLAHYMDDERFTQGLVSGKSEDGTDAHTLNWRALGPVCKSRAVAKTFIYAWLLGAGTAKIASILGCSIGEAREAVQNFLDNYPGLRYLKDTTIPRDAKRGYFLGLDGRMVPCDSEHLMLGGYLQNGEAVIMKRALIKWRTELKSKGIWFKQVNFVHDEWQTECNPQDAETIGTIQAASIVAAGEELNLKCPQKGNFKIGKNWLETH